jgi:fibronectin type 3 domain-containing protein
VVVSAISITGTGFAVSGATSPLTLQAGQTATINLQFDPKSSGAVSGQLTITSNATSNSTIGIGLTGTGASYSVSLTWAAPSGSSDQVVGYNIYRATGSSSTYVKLNSSVNAPEVFSDATVAIGASYDYYVTSVDSSGNESVPSNTATLNIP